MERNELHEIAEKEQARRKPVRVRCCTASGCRAVGGLAVKAALEQSVGERGLADRVEVVGVGCLGLCGHGPLVAVDPGGHLLEGVTPAAALSVLNAPDGGPVSAPRCDPGQPFFASQVRIATRTSGLIDPQSAEEYVAAGGYQALARVVTEMSPADVVAEITRSGLRGRGGAGYPTGLKWATVARATGGPKYVVGNGDEGDPGAFMDRSLMESDPHRILEGMAIAAFAVGASQAFLYVRAEYPAAVQRLRHAIEQARRLGVLGSGVFGSAFDFRIEVRIGAGAFVCGEETALMASVEGGRGTPRPRPPFPAESGLWGRPTLLNNVETFANVAAIIERGADWFAGIGTEKSKGTKVFALTGKVANTGLVEVPMGTTLRHVVEVMGGGVPGGRVKAVQTGGPSGGCIPASHLDTPVDYESLTRLGAIMGSGGMIVMDEDTNMVELARFFMGFCRDESCGKCVPCRAGTVQMHRLLTKIAERRGTQADLDGLLRLCGMVRETSLCGLGQSAPNPVLSAVRYFGDEFKALLQPVQPMGVPMPVLTLRVNDREITANSGQTVLSAAREAGIAIPTLCHLDGLSDVAACRLCLVEVFGTPKLLAACVTPVAEGMRVYTDTEKLRDYRRMIVELFLAERNHVCSVCVANGHCELQDLAAATGVDHVRFEYQFPALGVDASHKRFTLDHNRCILCTRCVRACDEIEGAHTWDVGGRGANSRVVTDMAQPWGEAATCTSCGKCVAACPTGALFPRGSTVAESEHDKGKLAFLITAREKKQWVF